MDILALMQANPVVNDIYQHLSPYLKQDYPYLLRAYPLLQTIYTSLLRPLYLFTVTNLMPLLLPLLEASLKVASQSPGIAVVVGVLDGGVGNAPGVWIGVLGGAWGSGDGGFAERGGEDGDGVGGGGEVVVGCFLGRVFEGEEGARDEEVGFGLV
ncbi:hypothetical protein BPOR_0405g00040 [Botrytis porri]|uniref:Uncharacterized protein n=1 Tax=Botrytis porri TaxID=87229 RepID=A0A4Z1KIG7_9HELO|nr:hypothetical protein BPOR_0405g00040 [Botrytis porri]